MACVVCGARPPPPRRSRLGRLVAGRASPPPPPASSSSSSSSSANTTTAATTSIDLCALCGKPVCRRPAPCARTLLLTPRQAPQTVCRLCSDDEANSCDTAAAHPILHSPVGGLVRGLSSLGLPLPGRRVFEAVQRGRAHFDRVVHDDNDGGGFRSLQEICDLTWFFLAAAAAKRQLLTSGLIVFEDPHGHRIFRALARHGYSRVLSSIKGFANERHAFGSSHFIDFILFSRTRGPWYVPDQSVSVPIGDGGSTNSRPSSPVTAAAAATPHAAATPQVADEETRPRTSKANGPCVTGYEQVGIDLRLRRLDGGAAKSVSASTDDDKRCIGVYLRRRHLLCGKLPRKTADDRRTFSFLKLETHGTASTQDALGHALSFLRTRGDVGKGKKSPAGSRRNTPVHTAESIAVVKRDTGGNGDAGPGRNGRNGKGRRGTDSPGLGEDNTDDNADGEDATGNAVLKRKEHVPVETLKAFRNVVEAAASVDDRGGGGVALFSTELTIAEVLKQRPKVLGLSFMVSIVSQIEHRLEPAARAVELGGGGGHRRANGALSNLRAALAMWRPLVTGRDHLDVRFGEEVIFSAAELLDFASSISRASFSGTGKRLKMMRMSRRFGGGGGTAMRRLVRKLRERARRAIWDPLRRSSRPPAGALLLGTLVLATVVLLALGFAAGWWLVFREGWARAMHGFGVDGVQQQETPSIAARAWSLWEAAGGMRLVGGHGQTAMQPLPLWTPLDTVYGAGALALTVVAIVLAVILSG